MMARATIPTASLYFASLLVAGIGLSTAGLFLLLNWGAEGGQIGHLFGAMQGETMKHAVDSSRTTRHISGWTMAIGIALSFALVSYGYAVVLWIRDLRRPINESAQDLLHAKYVLTVAQNVAHVGSWELDGATKEMHCSDELFRICGLEPQSVKPTLQFMFGLIHPEDREAASAAIIATRDEGREFRMQIRVVRPDGSFRHVIMVGQATRDKDGWVLKAIGALLDVTEQRETELALRHAHDQLRRLAAHQEHVREEERKHIARELHDELGGVLTGVRACLSVAMERSATGVAPINDLLLEASHLTDRASGTIRKVITELRPSILDQLGIWDALHWIAKQAESSGGLYCECACTDAAKGTPVDPESSIALFRIAQEALTNVVRHAKASKVTIRADRNGGSIMLEIADDGQGCDTHHATKKGGWGIVGMQERAHHLGGALSLHSVRGKGTIVSLRLPINSIA